MYRKLVATRFRRITSGGNFIPEIDGLRFVAITSVVAFHLYGYLRVKYGLALHGPVETLLDFGLRGVPLFFVISGFILGRPFAAHYIKGERKPQTKAYFIRRITRLEPPYLIVMAIFALVEHASLAHFLSSAFYLHNVIYGQPSTINSVAWSLEVEVQFYCLVPLVARVFGLPRIFRRCILGLAMFLGTANLLPVPGRFHLSILAWTGYFAAGLLLSDLYVDGWSNTKSWTFDLLSLVLWPAVFLMPEKAAWTLLPTCALLLSVAAFRSHLFQKFFALPPVTIVGGMCYTIYLIHYQVISFAGKLVHSPGLLILSAPLLLAVLSTAFFLAIERPCMDKSWPRRLFDLLYRAEAHSLSGTHQTGNEGSEA